MEIAKTHQSVLDMYYKEGHVKAWKYWKLLGFDYGIFLGEVSSDEFITGGELCSAIGLTAGNLLHDDTTWLKFILDFTILYVSKTHIRNGISWENIYQAGAVYGTDDCGLRPSGPKTKQNAHVTINDEQFRVTLMNGANSELFYANDLITENSWTDDSEWNRLMYPIHNGLLQEVYQNKTMFSKLDISKHPYARWSTYNDIKLDAKSDYSLCGYSWCKETVYVDNVLDDSFRVLRGGHGINNTVYDDVGLGISLMGYRPCLRLIEN